MEWLYDTLDETPAEVGPGPRGSFPFATFLLLGIGLAVIAVAAWLLFGTPSPVSTAPETTPSPSATVLLPTQVPAQLPAATASVETTLELEALPTSEFIFEIGERVIISGTGDRGIRLRSGASLNFLTQGIYYDNDAFFVMPGSDPNADYPVEADGYVWWRIRAIDGLIGWTVEDFLLYRPLVEEESDSGD
ncbi:MAG: hypothetical protein U9R25_19685 [Chloroflexota bacterium]|nr:hypothetical protein [Chloroflexota bacterium]